MSAHVGAYSVMFGQAAVRESTSLTLRRGRLGATRRPDHVVPPAAQGAFRFFFLRAWRILGIQLAVKRLRGLSMRRRLARHPVSRR